MQSVVKTYKSDKEYQKGLQAMQALGWAAGHVTSQRTRGGCLWPFASKSLLTVTYQREGSGCPNCGATVTPNGYFCQNCKAQLRT